MEKERRINWLGLFIKIVIIFVFILIIIWLIAKIVGKKNYSATFINNLNNMETVSINYFKTIDLPQKKRKSIKVTLGEMIEKDLIKPIDNNFNIKCDTKDSYAKITRKSKNYLVDVTLECGKEKDTKTSKFDFKDCKNCQTSSKKENKDEIDDNKVEDNTSNKNTSDVTGTNSAIVYYEYVKETTTYTKWMRGNVQGNNIDNKYEYYSISDDIYYSLSYIEKESLKVGSKIKYTLKLDKVPNNKYYFTTIKESNYFNSSEEKEYLNEKDISIYKGNSLDGINNYSSIKNYSLKENNFTYELSPYYRKGSFYVDVTISINNIDSITSYYDSKIKSDIIFIPIKLNIGFASNNIVSTKPTGEYETISYYRYIEKNRDVIWSSEEYVEGYIKTGNTK